MKTTIRHLVLGTTLILSSYSASAIVLPSGTCDGQNCIQFDDFQVYSLSLLNGGAVPGPNSPWFVNSTPGDIKDYIVVGVNGGGQASTNVAGISDAYNTPSANGESTFSGTGWTAQMSVLQQQFAGSQFVGFFAFNETGGTGGAQTLLSGGPDLLTWAKLTLVDADNSANNKSYYLQAPNTAYVNDPLGTTTLPGPYSVGYNFNTGTNDTGPWAYVHGSICMNGSVFTGFPDPEGNCLYGGSPKAQTDTGQNNAAFAMYNADLDKEIHTANTIYDYLTVDWQLAYINGGGETAWVQPVGTYVHVPEPSVLALFGIALAGLGVGLRRNKQ